MLTRAYLDHELLDDAVEDGALVVQGRAGLAQALLAGAQAAEVLGRLGDEVGVELHGDAAGGLVADGDVEEDAGVGAGGHGARRGAVRACMWEE